MSSAPPAEKTSQKSACGSSRTPDLEARLAAQRAALNGVPRTGRPTVTAVMTSFNKRDDVRKNLAALRSQSVPFDAIVVVDNHSSDGSADMIRGEFPEVQLVVMPHSAYGACETFNIGFACADTSYIAILDDDVVLPADWNERMLAKFAVEPASTALISSHVIEPGTPDWYLADPEVNRERYMATFRGCASLVRTEVLFACGGYDNDFFIYGNERDLASRLLRAGHRVLQYPSVVVRHGTPFGMKAGRRSLYYHVRNLWWYLFKHVAFGDIVRFLFRQATKPLRKSKPAEVCADAVGTIGIWQTIKETPGGFGVVLKATIDAFLGLPRCLRQRVVCRAPDFRLPDA